MLNFTGKNILMIAPKFYGYELKIKKNIESKGGFVYLIYENLDRISLLYRIVYVYFSKMKGNIIYRYYKKRINKIDKVIDYIFIIRGSSLSDEVMNMLKEKFQKAEFIQYQWDSIGSNKNAVQLVKWCNRNFTFDFEDAKDKNWKYRPLFCYKEKKVEKNIDISFIGTLHTDRLEIIKRISDFCKRKRYVFFIHLYSNRIIYIKKKYIEHNKRYIGLKDKDIKFKALSLDKTSKIYGKTKVVVDYTAEQTGLTMRTIESLCNGCKLVTNNPYIKETDLYSENNVYIYQGINCIIPTNFIKEPFVELDQIIKEKYTLDAWINDIFGEFEEIY